MTTKALTMKIARHIKPAMLGLKHKKMDFYAIRIGQFYYSVSPLCLKTHTTICLGNTDAGGDAIPFRFSGVIPVLWLGT